MTKPIMSVLAAALAAALTACQCAPPAPATHDAELESAFNGFIAAFNALDWERFRQSFAADASLFNPDIPDAVSLARIDGGDQVQASFERVFDAARKAGGGPDIKPHHVRIQSYGATAIVSFEFDRQGGSLGRRSLVFEWEDGRWKIVHIHASNVTRR